MSDEKSRFDEGYDLGYESGLKARPEIKDAKERLYYLQQGGEWQRDTEGDPYVAGFQDALKTLGVIK